MNSLDWFAQVLLAAIFLVAGLSKVFAFQWETAMKSGPSLRCIGVPRTPSLLLALLEIALALVLIVPLNIWQPEILPSLAAAGLGMLTLFVALYRFRRNEHASPMIALFLLTLFVIVGRW
jgi:hypothetical protein